VEPAEAARPAGRRKSEKPAAAARSTATSPAGATARGEPPAAANAAGADAGDLPPALRPTDSVAERLQVEGTGEQAPTPAAPDGDARPSAIQRIHAAERFSDQLLQRSATDPATGHDLRPADQQRLIQRVARAIEAASQRGGPLRLRLRPPELGRLRLEVSLRDGQLSARIEAETEATKSLLLHQLPQLRERLAERGFQVTQFDVDVSQQQGGDHAFDAPDAEHAPRRTPGRVQSAAARPASTELAPDQYLAAQPGRLNVVI